MRGVFTREERAVVLFLTVSLLVGSAIVGAGRVLPGRLPDFTGAAPVEGRAEAPPEPSWPVDVNTADVVELDRLPGVGPARARLIVELRERLGGYSSLEELLEVRGIGPVTLDKLRDKAVVGPRITDAPATVDQDRARRAGARADSSATRLRIEQVEP
jgi:competence ComEA-like helix-hairpin-helix protein